MDINYNEIEKQEVQPNASSMIETFRAIGYNLETALADIIDNSITAKAKHIWIQTVWNGDKTAIIIKDDGCGMNAVDLTKALTPGLTNPLSDRDEEDLGRFGLGLKTASFSQCRMLSVMSKKKGYHEVFWSWDLDYVASCGKWELIKWFPEDFVAELANIESGTIVVWSNLDRIIPKGIQTNDTIAQMKFFDLWTKAKQHISMTFHRFIEDEDVEIIWGDYPLKPWNPFCVDNPATQIQPAENIFFNDSMATIKAFVLPHRSKVSEEEYNAAEGPLGYTAQQGFYIYRGKRLLLGGGWLKLFRNEEYYKLVRIRIDLPNTLDSMWQIDIKKSTATPPIVCREQLMAYARKAQQLGLQTFRQRSKILKQRAGREFQPLWLDVKRDNKWSFVLNRDNEIIKDLIRSAHENPEKSIESLLRMIEAALPSESIYYREAKSGGVKETPNFDISVIKSMAKQIYDNKISEGYSREQAVGYLKTIEPFNNFEEVMNEIE